jgi:hypothetical protein
MYGDATHMIHKKSLPDSSAGLIRNSSLILLIFSTAILLMTSTALGEASNITVSPENPSPGDKVTVSGEASPYEEISVSIDFEKIQSVSEGSYEYRIGKITIPEGSDSFSLRAEGVDSLDITLYVLGQGLPSLPVTVNNGIATFGTSKITSGTYDIGVSGTSSSNEVTLTFGGRGSITADSEGNFQYSYTTENMPEGDFTLNVGGQTQQVSLGTTDDSSDDGDSSSSSSSSSKKKSSSHTGTELNIVPAESLGDDTEKSSGVGDEIDTKASTQDSGSESSEADTDTGEVDGYILENKSSSGIQSKIPELGVVGAVVGVLCLGAIFIRFRKNRYK